jgi:hypothetical protein
VSRVRAAYFSLFAACGLAYVYFRLHRSAFAPGLFRSSFPSLLVTIIVFAVFRLLMKSTPAKRSTKIAGEVLLLAFMAVWLEYLIPRLLPGCVGDFGDVVAMVLGFSLFQLLSISNEESWFDRSTPKKAVRVSPDAIDAAQ